VGGLEGAEGGRAGRNAVPTTTVVGRRALGRRPCETTAERARSGGTGGSTVATGPGEHRGRRRPARAAPPSTGTGPRRGSQAVSSTTEQRRSAPADSRARS